MAKNPSLHCGRPSRRVTCGHAPQDEVWGVLKRRNSTHHHVQNERPRRRFVLFPRPAVVDHDIARAVFVGCSTKNCVCGPPGLSAEVMSDRASFSGAVGLLRAPRNSPSPPVRVSEFPRFDPCRLSSWFRSGLQQSRPHAAAREPRRHEQKRDQEPLPSTTRNHCMCDTNSSHCSGSARGLATTADDGGTMRRTSRSAGSAASAMAAWPSALGCTAPP